MYALAGVNDDSRGWGRSGESERVSVELSAHMGFDFLIAHGQQLQP